MSPPLNGGRKDGPGRADAAGAAGVARAPGVLGAAGVASAPPALPGEREPPALYRLGLLWFIGADLRMAVLALPPVLPDIQRQLRLSETAIGALTTLPVLVLALGAVAGSAAVARLGPRITLIVGLVIVGVSSGARGLGGAVWLFLASVTLGIGIAILQPTMPSITKAWFAARVGLCHQRLQQRHRRRGSAGGVAYPGPGGPADGLLAKGPGRLGVTSAGGRGLLAMPLPMFRLAIDRISVGPLNGGRTGPTP